MDSLEMTDKQAAEVAVAPRVQLKDIESAMAGVFYTDAASACGDAPMSKGMSLLTMCIIEMKNGFVVVGKSAPASAENFNAILGRKFAYEDAVRQLWPLMGYALRERLHHGW